MTDDECIAMAWLHCKGEPFWLYEVTVRHGEIWQLRSRANVLEIHPMESREADWTGKFYFGSRARAARVYCEYHGLLEGAHS